MQGEPRAVVAVSEDRQWLVVHYKGGGFVIYTKRGYGMDEPFEVWDDDIEDTGQDAHKVLRELLGGEVPKTITFDGEELDTILDAVNILQRRAIELRGHPLVADSADLSLAIAAVQIRCRNIENRINQSPLDAAESQDG